MPRTLHGNKEAQKKWKKIVELYLNSDLAIVGSGDEEALERYCVTYAEYYKLLAARKKIEEKYEDSIELLPKALFDSKVDGLLKVKMDVLNRLDTKLLLTPLDKIHTRPVPRIHNKTPDMKTDPSDKFHGL